ncbi:MAG: 4'-phosphopantetheinyl transferase superfamily protein [Methanobrevibacter sp.]|jgi:4'-phosphopantetheinyl transferase|nr:4'-phosphopantetheinyl transferase superfamily protein [Candidatus Methanoflexus mossambicus]
MNVSKLDIGKILHLISDDRLKKIDNFVFLKDKKLSAGGELLLNYVLKTKYNIKNPTYNVNDYGKPYLVDYPNIHFNISHSGDYVVCGVSKFPIGVDIEFISDKFDLKIAKKYFHEKEYEYILNHTNQKYSFFKFWVLKESYLKNIGFGLNENLKSFIFDVDTIDNDNIHILGKSHKFALFEIENKYLLAICSFENSNNIIPVNIDPIKILNYEL